MDPGTEQWEQVKSLFDATLRQPPGERERFLVERCPDEEIRVEVLSLLRNDESAADFLRSAPEQDFAATASRTPLRAISIKTRLGPYEITDFLGAGGMGEVYRAIDTRLNRKVAIKVLPAQFANDRERLRRFEQEARAVAALNHPNILALYDIGVQDGMPYVVSELLEGGTLRQQLLNGPLSVRKSVDCGVQIARGLSAAHAQGIVHRDLKPENIFITEQSHIKILDFGLAKFLSTKIETSTVASATSAGMVVGTAGYMSPEQVRGESVNHVTDIFSFGAVLYEMLSGQRAFKRDSNIETMNAILKEDPPDISAQQPKIPQSICQIVERCLEKNPNERFHSAHDLAFALEAASGGPSSAPPTTITPETKTRHVRKAWAFGAIALVAITSTIGWLLAFSRYSAEDLSLQQLTFRRGVVENARFTPDGATILYGATWDGDQSRTYMLRRDSPASLPLEPVGAVVESIFPSGELLTQLSDSEKNVLATVPITGGAPRPILEGVEWADVSPSDGQPAIVKESSGKNRIEYPPGNVIYATATFVGYLRFAPNGKFLAFIEWPVRADDTGWVTIIDISGKKRAASSEFGSVQGLAWAPDSREVWLTGSKIRALRNVYALSVSGHERLVYRTPSPLTIKDISSDGRVLFTRDDVKWGIAGEGPLDSSERDYSWSDFSLAVDLSRDGKTLLFQDAGDAGNGATYAIYIRRLDGSPAVRLGSGAAQGFSPDGNWILECTNASPKQLLLLPVGVGQEKALTNDSLNHLAAAWFPDGKSILFEGNEPGHPLRLFIQKIDAATPVPLTPEGASFWGITMGEKMISSDGQSIFAQAPDGSTVIYRLDGSARRPLGLSGNERFVGWSADPDVIYDIEYSHSNGRTIRKIYRTNIRTGRKMLWKEIQPSDPAGFGLYDLVVSPDAKSYFYTYERELFTLFLAKGLR